MRILALSLAAGCLTSAITSANVVAEARQVPTSPAPSVTPACPEPEARQFDFWIGEWNVRNRNRRPNSDDPTWYDTGRATNRVHGILRGCAVVEHWRGEVNRNEILGFSVRAFNPVTEEWDLVLLWPSPDQPRFGTLQGGFTHGRGEFFFDGQDAQGAAIRNRYSFADVTPTSLRWDAAVSTDDGLTWKTNWIMEFTRRSPLATPLQNAHTSTHGRCSFSEIRTLDGLSGQWQGATADGGTPVTFESVPILEGCGAMDFITVGSGEAAVELFHVRTYDRTADEWAMYRMDTRTRVLHKLTGPRQGDGAELSGRLTGLDGDVAVQTAWQLQDDETSLRWTLTETPAGGSQPAVDLDVMLTRR